MASETLITAILGSPRRRGNSDTLAMEFLRGAAAKGFGHKLIIPTDLAISPCDGSNRCFTDGRCTIADGMNAIYDEVLAASLRHPMHVVEAALAGADVATIPFKVME